MIARLQVKRQMRKTRGGALCKFIILFVEYDDFHGNLRPFREAFLEYAPIGFHSAGGRFGAEGQRIQQREPVLRDAALRFHGEAVALFPAETDKRLQIKTLGEIVADTVPRDVEIEWYGDPDHRSYKVDFSKIESLGFRCDMTIEKGVEEMAAALEKKITDKTDKTITLKWYQNLMEWNETLQNVTIGGKVF